MHLPEPLRRLADQLAELPSIGPRQAIRLAFHLAHQGANTVDSLARDIASLANIKTCAQCFFLHEQQGVLCAICANPKRNQGIIAIVEKETDLISIENTNQFPGRYLIAGAIPKTGILDDWQKLRLQHLKAVIDKDLGGQAEELILAFNPTAGGNFAASLIAQEMKGKAKRITRLGRGLPTGGEIEFADDETLGAALERRS